MYHSWDSQNAWLRQIHSHNHLHMHPSVGQHNGFDDGDWIWVESMHGKVRCQCKFSEAVEPGTVWTWNAIGKAAGAWGLDKNANEARQGFLLNHLIAEEIPLRGTDKFISNSDPVTGQAGWYDVRVKVYKAEHNEPEITWPQFKPMKPLPGMMKKIKGPLGYASGKGLFKKLLGGGKKS
jgi:anaerobic selenocysteine-containing dehydrogenase